MTKEVICSICGAVNPTTQRGDGLMIRVIIRCPDCGIQFCIKCSGAYTEAQIAAGDVISHEAVKRQFAGWDRVAGYL
jgi:hypothetical protein